MKKRMVFMNDFMTSVFDEVDFRAPHDTLPFGDDTDDEENNETGKFVISKIECGMDMYSVKGTDYRSSARARMHASKLTRVSDEKTEIITVSASLFAENKRSQNFTFNKTNCTLLTDSRSVIINDSNADKLTVGISYPVTFYFPFGEGGSYPLTVLFAVDSNTFGMFETYEAADRIHSALSKYNGLTSAQRKFFKRQYASPRKASEQSGVYTPIRDEGALRVLFETCRHTYDEHVQAKAEMILDILKSSSGYGEKADLKNQLSHILGINTHHEPIKKIGFYEIMEAFNRKIYGLTDFKEKLAEFILAMQYSKDISFAALLIGSPGVGKTSAAEVMAECTGKELLQIDCSGADVIAMSGLVRSYGGAKAGKVIDGLWEAGKSDLLLFFDEIDKLSITKEGNPYSIFLKALGPQRMLHDEYVETDIDISSSLILASANNIDDVPGYVLNRFGDNIFFIDDYSAEEKVEIAKQFTIRKVLIEHRIDAERLIMSDEALYLLAEEYCEDAGMREMTGYLRTIARKAIRLWHCNEIEKLLIVDEDFIKNYIKKKPSLGGTVHRKAGF